MATKRPPSLLRTLRLIALAVTLFGISNVASAVFFNNNTFSTQAIVLEFAPNDTFFGPGRTPVMAFVDFRNNKRISSPLSALGTGDLQLGQKRDIRYDSFDPNVFRLDTPLGMWGDSALRLLMGLIPLIFLSISIASSGKKAPARAAWQPKKGSIKPVHLIRHTGDSINSDTPAVRRMR